MRDPSFPPKWECTVSHGGITIYTPGSTMPSRPGHPADGRARTLPVENAKRWSEFLKRSLLTPANLPRCSTPSATQFPSQVPDFGVRMLFRGHGAGTSTASCIFMFNAVMRLHICWRFRTEILAVLLCRVAIRGQRQIYYHCSYV